MTVNGALAQIEEEIKALAETDAEWATMPEDQRADTQIWWHELVAGKLNYIIQQPLSAAQVKRVETLLRQLRAAEPYFTRMGLADLTAIVNTILKSNVPVIA